jgi:superfamily II DNA or RNA helicase
VFSPSLIFCAECECYLKKSEAYLCSSCRKYFCREHIGKHDCKIGGSTGDEEGVKERDWVRIEGLPGIFKVLSVKDLGTRQMLIVKSLSDEKLYEVPVPPRRIDRLLKPLERVMRANFDPPEKFDIFVDALRLRYAYLYDPASILSISKIDPLPHQIEAVYGRMLDSPEPRFLLADDVGLGKTIEAGMLLKELKLRGRIKRILIVVPPALQYKWQKELRERFNEIFQVYTSETLKTPATTGNPWTTNDQIITSIDLAKMHPHRDWLRDVEWDLVIIDEAHKLAAHKYGNKIYLTDRFRLGELLHTRTKCFLLLTATPHSGEDYAFYRLVSLVDPYLFPSEYHVNREKLKRVMIRRIKEDLHGIFPPRESRTLSVEFSEEEKRLYSELTRYVGYYFNLAKEEARRGVGFAMVILQKRMASSIYAIKQSLRNRLEKLEKLLKLPIKAFPELAREDMEILEEYEKNPEDIDEMTVEEAMRSVEALTMARNKEELEIEIGQIRHLLELLDQVKVDSKARFLIDFIKKLHAEAPDEKVLIFTEYRDTMEYLRKLFEDEGYRGRIAYIHGSMSVEEREAQAKAFRNYDHIKVMVATDAAAEGIDLQHNCHIMVNYELPWNPNRIEQRMGRLHRYGQKKAVLVYNLLVKDTIEGAVFEKLLWKLDRIRSAMGERVFDVIGVLLSEVKIPELIMSIIAEEVKTFEARIEAALRRIDERRKLINMLEKKCLIRDSIDWGFFSSMRERIAENAIGESDVERFMERFIMFNGGDLEEVDNGVYRVKLTGELERIMQLDDGVFVTFSREVAEKKGVRLITLGSSIMDRVLKVSTDPAFGGWATIKVDPKGREGFLFIYSYSVTNVKGDLTWKKLFTLFYDLNSREVHIVNPKRSYGI